MCFNIVEYGWLKGGIIEFISRRTDTYYIDRPTKQVDRLIELPSFTPKNTERKFTIWTNSAGFEIFEKAMKDYVKKHFKN